MNVEDIRFHKTKMNLIIIFHPNLLEKNVKFLAPLSIKTPIVLGQINFAEQSNKCCPVKALDNM